MLGLADSAFNERELIELDYAATAVAPLLIDMSRTGQVPDPVVARRLAAKSGPSILFVG